MKKIFKALFIGISVACIAAACFSFLGCEKNKPDNGGNSGNTGNTGGGETYIDYNLNSFVYSMTGAGDYYVDINDMSATDHATYDAVIAMYGKKVKISENNLQFVDGTALKAFGKMSYTLSGDNVNLSEPAISQTFNYLKLSGGIFSIGVEQTIAGNTVKYSFDYYSPNATAPSYTVKFDTNGGGIVPNKTVKKGMTVTKPATPQKTGYTFSAWYSDKNLTQKWDFTNDKVFSDTTLYAKWTAKANSVTFQTNGGTEIRSQTVESGKKITRPENPQKTGYEFLGWYSDKNLTQEWNFDTVITGNKTLYAKYTPSTYVLNFNANDGTCATAQKTVAYDGKVGELPVPVRENFLFGGWYNNNEHYTEDTIYTNVGNTALTAKWITEITLDTDGLGTVEKNKVSAAVGWTQGEQESLPNAICGSAEFVGWYTQPSGMGEKYENSDKFNFDGPITLYAAWRVTVNYDAAGGTAASSGKVIRGNVFTPATTTRTGYTFAGWYDDDGNLVDKNTKINKDGAFTLTARWTANQITFNFDAEGGECEKQKIYTYDSPFGQLPTPYKAGNEFAGWYSDRAGKGNKYDEDTVCKDAQTITLYAKWTADIIFEYEGATSGNEVKKLNFTYNSMINVSLPQPYKMGYSFEGWFARPDGAGGRLTDTGIVYPENTSGIWALDGDTHFYAYWVKGTDKRYLTYSTGSAVTVTGLKDNSLTELDIPAIIDLKPVTAIANYAFRDTLLTGVTVPYSVTSIGKGAFKGCPLTEISIPFVGNTASAEKEYSVFGYIFDYGKNSHSTGDTCQYSYAFNDYWYSIPQTLEKVTVTGSYALPAYAFRNCSMLKDVVLEGKITKIGSYAFSGCTGIADFKFKDELKTIEGYAFENTKLTSVTVPDGVTFIGVGAFKGCPLTEITLPFVGINSDATGSSGVLGFIFGYERSSYDPVANAIMQIRVENYGYYWYYIPQTLEKVTVTGSYALPAYAFRNCTMLKEVNLTGTVSELGGYAFAGCENLPVINGLENVIKVNEYAFDHCENLTTFPTKPLETVGGYAFNFCGNLTEISFSENLTSIGDYAFNRTGISQITLPSNLKTLGISAFRDTLLTDVTVPDSVTSIGVGAFRDCSLTEITIPFVGNTATATKEYSVFGYIFGYECGSYDPVANAIMQIRVEYYGYYWYYIPQTLEKVTVTGSYALPAYAFRNCTMLKEVNLTGTVSEFGGYAFAGCTNLPAINGLENVTKVNEYAFDHCENLTTFPTKPLETVGGYAFNFCGNLTEISFSENLTSIGDYAFNRTGISQITLPSNLKTLGMGAFRYTQLTSVTVPDSVTSIGVGAFRDCSLTEITIPFVGNTATATKEYSVFGYIFGYECGSYDPVANAIMQIRVEYYGYYWYYIPQTLEKVTVTGSYALPAYAFNNCTMLKEINLTGTITEIGDYAFAGCTGLETITFGGEVPALGSGALSGLSQSVVITVPAEYLEEYKQKFDGFTVIA